MVDALALKDDEGREKLREVVVISEEKMIHKFPNEGTRWIWKFSLIFEGNLENWNI